MKILKLLEIKSNIFPPVHFKTVHFSVAKNQLNRTRADKGRRDDIINFLSLTLNIKKYRKNRKKSCTNFKISTYFWCVFFRMFATSQCSACGQTIAPNEFVMRTTSSNQQQTTPVENNNKPFSFETNHVFHLKCFTCSKCATQLRPGDRYVLWNRQHYQWTWLDIVNHCL